MELTTRALAEIIYRNTDPIEASEIVAAFHEQAGAVSALMALGPRSFENEQAIIEWIRGIVRQAKQTGDA